MQRFMQRYTALGIPFFPQGHEIVRIDLDAENGNVVGTTTVFAEDVGTPLPIAFHPNGDLYFAVFGSNGKLYKITSF